MWEWISANAVEIFGFATGLVCVVLAARRHILNFPIGIVNNLVFIVLFWGAALYADVGLQVVYIALAVAGWIGWSRARAADERPATVNMPTREIPWLVGAGVAATLLLTWVLTAFTDSTTQLADAATTAFSLVAQYMLNRRYIQAWFVWIAVDVGLIALLSYKGLYITAALYLVFIGVCVHGYLTWRRAPHLVADAAARESVPVA